MSTPQIDVEKIVDESRLGPFQIKVVCLCSLVSLLDGYDLQTMAFLIPTLSETWGIAPAGFRLALSASLIGLAIGALTAGPPGDRFGRRRVLLISLALLIISTFASAAAMDLRTISVWRFLTGLGLGASLPNVIAMTAEYVPEKNRALMLSLMLCGLPLGGALGGPLAAVLIADYGWQSVFIIGGIVPLLLLAGAGIIGAQFCLNALAASYYPTFVRATGVGWALGMGRIGAIVSPFAGAALVAAAWPASGFFAAAAVPLLVCAACMLLMGWEDNAGRRER